MVLITAIVATDVTQMLVVSGGVFVNLDLEPAGEENVKVKMHTLTFVPVSHITTGLSLTD